MTSEQFGELAAAGTAVLWTFSTLAWTSAGRSVGALSVSFIRLIIATVFLMAYGGLMHGHWLPTDAGLDSWLCLSVSGFFGFLVADFCLVKAFLSIGPRLSLLILSLSPPMAALTSCLCLNDPFAARHWLAMGITLAGVTWVVLEEPEPPNGEPRPRQRPQYGLGGIALALLGAFGQAVGTVLSKRGMSQYDDATGATFIRVIGGMAGYLVLITLLRRWRAITLSTRNTRAMVILTLGAFAGPFLGVILSMVSLRHCHPGTTATIISTMPVLFLPLAVLVYHEKISPRAVIGAVISVAGVALLVW